MLLIVEDSLIKMTDAPTQGDVVVEEFREFCSCLAGVGIAPCAERHKNLLLLVESHVAVHHSTEADGGKSLNLAVVLLLNILAELGVAVLKSVPYSLCRVGPETVYQLILPLV